MRLSLFYKKLPHSTDTYLCLRPKTTEFLRPKSEQVFANHQMMIKVWKLLLIKSDRFSRDLLFKQHFWMTNKIDLMDINVWFVNVKSKTDS
jgi:hypothetical protein